VFDGFNEIAGLVQTLVGAGIEPGKAAAHDFDAEFTPFQIEAVQVGDFEFAPGRRLEVARQLNHGIVVEVEAGDRVVALGHLGLFFKAGGAPLAVEGHYAITFGVMHMGGEDRRAGLALHGALQQGLEVVTVEDVVAQHQGTWTVADEVRANNEGLGQAVRAGLHRVSQIQPPVAAVAQKLLEARRILGS